jgi:hypothetical protein
MLVAGLWMTAPDVRSAALYPSMVVSASAPVPDARPMLRAKIDALVLSVLCEVTLSWLALSSVAPKAAEAPAWSLAAASKRLIAMPPPVPPLVVAVALLLSCAPTDTMLATLIVPEPMIAEVDAVLSMSASVLL